MTKEELLERGEETVTLRQIVERFDAVEEEYSGMPWTLKQIYTQIDMLVSEKPCGDCISREAALDDAGLGEFHRYDDYVKMQNYLKSLPSVTPQPKIGRWIMSDDGLYRPICNNCGAHPWKGYIPTVEEATEVFKYCPNCGSDNREVEE